MFHARPPSQRPSFRPVVTEARSGLAEREGQHAFFDAFASGRAIRPRRDRPHRGGPGPAAGLPNPGRRGSGVAAIYAAFGGSSGLSWALRVARCQSGYTPRAYNPSSGASGLFQFLPSTWYSHFPGWNIWDPYAHARAARIFYDHG